MKLLRVCFLTERMLLGYGVDLVVDRLASGLARGGFDVTVCCNIHDDTFLGAPYELRRFPYERSPLRPAQTERNAARALADFPHKFDALVACTFPYYQAAASSGKPWVGVDFGVVPPQFFGWRINRELRHHWRAIYERCFPMADAIVCISDYLRQRLPAESRKRARVVYPGVDHYPRKFLCNVSDIFSLDEPVVLSGGRSRDTSPYKNVDALLRIYRTIKRGHPHARLLLSTSCGFEEQARLEHMGAVVINAATMEFMPSIYNSADIYATATLWEGLDLPLLEAAYFGLPSVAFPVGAHPEVVQHGRTGFLAKDEAGFSECLIQLIESKSLRMELGRTAKEFASTNFRWKNAISEYSTILDGLN